MAKGADPKLTPSVEKVQKVFLTNRQVATGFSQVMGAAYKEAGVQLSPDEKEMLLAALGVLVKKGQVKQ